jgi:hypothetical protein
MTTPIFKPIPISYTGLYADQHAVDAQQFGRSISSAARIANSLTHFVLYEEIGSPRRQKVKFFVIPSKKNGLLQELARPIHRGL